MIGSEHNASSENYSLVPITIAPYLVKGTDGTARMNISVAGAKADNTHTNAKQAETATNDDMPVEVDPVAFLSLSDGKLLEFRLRSQKP